MVRWKQKASGRPFALQSAAYPRLTDLELNLRGPYALLWLLPEGCCRQQLYFSTHVTLLMWLHTCRTDTVTIPTQPQPLHGAGWVTPLEFPAGHGQSSSEHPPTGKGDKCHLQVGDRYSGEEKASHHSCWYIAFYGTVCHIWLLIYEHPHHIISAKQDIFTSLYPTKITLWLKYVLTL